MKELVIISGKGGTGKTSVTAAFAALASRTNKVVFADCDVDAADLHLILNPEIKQKTEFVSGNEALINAEKCVGCGRCEQLCRFGAVRRRDDGKYEVSGCEGCGVCVRFCPAHAIAFPERRCGEWYISETRFGPLIHAQLYAGAENSGKLVSLVRKEARLKAEALNADYSIVDGCPGIGCPVIASLTGADEALAVVEPSLSSKHDLERVIELTRHFKIPLWVLINKYDINVEIAAEIKNLCGKTNVSFAGLIGYDTVITAAQIQGKSVVEYSESSPIVEQIASIWERISKNQI